MNMKDLIKLMKSDDFYENNSIAIIKEQVLKLIVKYELSNTLIEVLLDEVPKPKKKFRIFHPNGKELELSHDTKQFGLSTLWRLVEDEEHSRTELILTEVHHLLGAILEERVEVRE